MSKRLPVIRLFLPMIGEYLGQWLDGAAPILSPVPALLVGVQQPGDDVVERVAGRPLVGVQPSPRLLANLDVRLLAVPGHAPRTVVLRLPNFVSSFGRTLNFGTLELWYHRKYKYLASEGTKRTALSVGSVPDRVVRYDHRHRIGSRRQANRRQRGTDQTRNRGRSPRGRDGRAPRRDGRGRERPRARRRWHLRRSPRLVERVRRLERRITPPPALH